MDIMLYLIPLTIFLCILMQAFFSNSEMAMVSSNKIRLDYLAKNGNRRAAIILHLLDNPNKLFGTTLVGINLATIIGTALSDYYFHNIITDYFPNITRFISLELLTFIIMEPLILIGGEIFPMTIGRKFPNTVALRNARIIRAAYFIFFPLMFIVSSIAALIGKLLQSSSSLEFGRITRDELQLLVAGRFTQVTEKTRQIIEDVFDISKLVASDVMIHLNEVVSISDTATVEEFKEVIKLSNYSRVPIYSVSVFNIIATIHAMNVLGADDKDLVIDHSEKLYIVPSTKPVVQILSELKRNRKYMGIVVDEYGAVIGIITIENIAEELVGEIMNDTRKDEDNNTDEKNVFSARTYLDEFYEQTGFDLTGENADTLGGIVNLALGRIGKKGDKVIYKGIEMEILDATDRLVKKVKILSSVPEKLQ